MTIEFNSPIQPMNSTMPGEFTRDSSHDILKYASCVMLKTPQFCKGAQCQCIPIQLLTTGLRPVDDTLIWVRAKSAWEIESLYTARAEIMSSISGFLLDNTSENEIESLVKIHTRMKAFSGLNPMYAIRISDKEFFSYHTKPEKAFALRETILSAKTTGADICNIILSINSFMRANKVILPYNDCTIYDSILLSQSLIQTATIFTEDFVVMYEPVNSPTLGVFARECTINLCNGIIGSYLTDKNYVPIQNQRLVVDANINYNKNLSYVFGNGLLFLK